MKTKYFLLSTAILLIFIAGCAPHYQIKECLHTTPYGFWGGLWHGIISPVSFVLSLFSDNIKMYAVNNNGGWYDFGFVLGAGILFGGSSKATKKS